MSLLEIPPLQVQPAQDAAPRLPELLALALLLTYSSQALPRYALGFLSQNAGRWIQAHLGWQWALDIAQLAFVLILTLPTAHRSGIRIGSLRPHWRKVLIIIAIPILLTALVYPRLHTRPFTGASAAIWTISPLGQDLFFAGYLYGSFARIAGRWFHTKIPINGAVLLTATFFALWHLPNLASIPAGYVLFQMCYVFLGATFTGMTRVLTGSVFYITISHMAVNFIAAKF